LGRHEEEKTWMRPENGMDKRTQWKIMKVQKMGMKLR
jgi:hypothetical protein